MPTYVYECRTCEKTFEIEQRITEDALTDCDCGAIGGLRRVIQPVGVMFKGSGFYVNDAPTKAPTPAETPSTPECTSEPASCPACKTPETN